MSERDNRSVGDIEVAQPVWDQAFDCGDPRAMEINRAQLQEDRQVDVTVDRAFREIESWRFLTRSNS